MSAEAHLEWWKKAWRSGWLPALLLVGLTMAAYWPALHGGFIWDDDDHLTRNPCIIGPHGLKEIWTTKAARTCPLVLTSFWAQHALWGLNPLPYHLVNILVHAASAVVLWGVLRGMSVRGAWLGAAFWALHPVQVESVAWMTELKNTQSGLFYLLAIWFFVKSKAAEALQDPRGTNRYYVLTLLCGALAMASKSSTVVLPVVLGLCAWWMDGRWRARNVVRLAPLLFMSAAAAVLSLWTQKLEGAAGTEWTRTWPERIVVAGKVVWFYLGKLLWPHPLIFIYPQWKINGTQVASYLPALAVIVVLFVLWRNRNGWGRPGFLAFAYFLTALSPVLGLVNHYFLRYSFVGDHFQYLACIGPLALAASGITTGLGSFEKGRLWLQPAVGGALLLTLGTLTCLQTTVYVNNETLFRTTLARNPDCWMAHSNLGVRLREQGKAEEALAHFREALRLKPDFAEALFNLGALQLENGQVDEAFANSKAALRSQPNHWPAWNNLGAAYLSQGHTEEAIESFRTSLKINPTYLPAWNNLGSALRDKGRLDEAIECYRKGLQVNPGNPDALINLGVALVERKQYGEAISQYQAALRSKPDYARAFCKLGDAMIAQGKFGEAVAYYESALRAQSDYAEAHNNLGCALAAMGKTDEAMPHYNDALRLNGKYPQAHFNLGYALLQLGHREEAVGHLREALRLKPDYAEAKEQLRALGVQVPQ